MFHRPTEGMFKPQKSFLQTKDLGTKSQGEVHRERQEEFESYEEEAVQKVGLIPRPFPPSPSLSFLFPLFSIIILSL